MSTGFGATWIEGGHTALGQYCPLQLVAALPLRWAEDNALACYKCDKVAM